MRLVDHVYDDQVIDSLTVKIILPEGARSVFAKKNLQFVWAEKRFLQCLMLIPHIFPVMSYQKHPRGYTLQNWSHAKPAALHISGYVWPTSAGRHQEQPGGASHSRCCGKTHTHSCCICFKGKQEAYIFSKCFPCKQGFSSYYISWETGNALGGLGLNLSSHSVINQNVQIHWSQITRRAVELSELSSCVTFRPEFKHYTQHILEWALCYL